MSILTRVREHARRNAPRVVEHVRGVGSRTVKFTGEYAGKAGHRLSQASSSAKMTIADKLQEAIEAHKERVEAIKEQRSQEKSEAELAYLDEKMKIENAKQEARLEQIKAKARLRAREGGFFTRTAKAGIRKALEEAKKEAKRR